MWKKKNVPVGILFVRNVYREKRGIWQKPSFIIQERDCPKLNPSYGMRK